MVELTVVGSINLDLVARVERLPRPGETLAASAFERIPGGKGANQAVAAARLGARVQLIGAVGDDALAEEALAGLHEAGVRAGGRPDGRDGPGVDPRRRRRREPDRRRAGRERRCPAPPGRGCGALPARGAGRGRARGSRRGQLLRAQRRAGPPDRRRAGSADRQPARARGRVRAAISSPSRSAPTAQRCTRTAARSHGRRRRRSMPSTGRPPATRSQPVWSSRCSKAGRVDEALTRACAAGALAASRQGAQPSLPTRDEVDAILAT